MLDEAGCDRATNERPLSVKLAAAQPKLTRWCQLELERIGAVSECFLQIVVAGTTEVQLFGVAVQDGSVFMQRREAQRTWDL